MFEDSTTYDLWPIDWAEHLFDAVAILNRAKAEGQSIGVSPPYFAEGTVRPAISCQSYPQPYPQAGDKAGDSLQRGRAWRKGRPPVLKKYGAGTYTPQKEIFAKVKRI